MEFNDFLDQLRTLTKEAPDESTRMLASNFLNEIASIIFVRDAENAELFLSLFENKV